VKRVVVLGSGVVGVATAYFLAREGVEVTVIDRRAEAAAETSHANAGLISPGHAFAWASPRAPLVLLRSLWPQADPSFRLRFNPDPRFLAWGLMFLGQCTAARARANTEAKHRLSRYSQRQYAGIRAEAEIDDHRNAGGLLYVYRDADALARGVASMRIVEALGQRIEVANRARCVEIEPALENLGERMAGGIFCDEDESADCETFTRALAARCRELGVTFRFDTELRALHRDGERITAAETSRGEERADAFVLALGSYSPQIARTAGLSLPIYPVKGYSLTVPITDASRAPRIGFVDDGVLMAFSRLGDRLRITAKADFAGYDLSYTARDFAALDHVGRELFAAAADFERPSHWTCLRPLTPDGPPLLGRGRLANLFHNTGHGSLGWTMGPGSGRVVADLMLGRRPEIDLAGLEARRYRGA